MLTAMDDPIIQRIECFRCSRGTLHAERRNRGYTLYRARSGALVARLRPTGSDDRFEVLYWSLWKDRWASTGPFGRRGDGAPAYGCGFPARTRPVRQAHQLSPTASDEACRPHR